MKFFICLFVCIFFAPIVSAQSSADVAESMLLNRIEAKDNASAIILLRSGNAKGREYFKHNINDSEYRDALIKSLPLFAHPDFAMLVANMIMKKWVGDATVRYAVIEQIANLRTSSRTKFLAQFLMDEDVKIRTRIAETVSLFPSRSSSEIMKAMLASEDEVLQLNAIKAYTLVLGRWGKKDIPVEKVLAWAKGTDKKAYLAARLLVKMKHPKGNDLLRKKLAGKFDEEALGDWSFLVKYGDKTACNILLERTKSTDEEVAFSAALALISGDSFLGIPVGSKMLEQAEIGKEFDDRIERLSLSMARPQFLQLTWNGIENNKIPITASSMKFIGESGRDDMIGKFGSFAKSKKYNDETRAQALWGIAQINDTSALEIAIELSKDASPLVREKVAMICGGKNTPEVLGVILRLMNDGDEKVRRAARFALIGMNPEIVCSTLEKELAKATDDIIFDIIKILYKTPNGDKVLVTLLENKNDEIALHAADMILRMKIKAGK